VTVNGVEVGLLVGSEIGKMVGINEGCGGEVPIVGATVGAIVGAELKLESS
jgi:hypothetical protein